MDPSEEDYGMKECPECEGIGRVCAECGENPGNCTCSNGLGFRSCQECDGSGEVPRTFEDHQDELDYRAELDADCEREKDM